LLDVNPALVSMLGYGSKDELLAKNLKRDIYEEAHARASILEKYGPGGRVDGAEVKWRRKDGKSIAVRLSGRAVPGENGSTRYFEVIAEDVTERRSLEEQFRQAQKMEAVGLLAGGISHDFNNLLMVILGNTDLLLDQSQSEKQQRYLSEIKKATSRAAHLTQQLLAFSRKQVLYPTILDLNEVVREVGSILQRLIGEDIRVVMDLKTGLGAVRADRGQIEQILMNLATNARDAMPNGGQFTIRTENAKLDASDVARHSYIKPGSYTRIIVSDNGAGMSREAQARVFEPFFTTKPLGRGTGLGLATVYGIVKQSGGYIWISSTLGAGASFDIYLPRVEQQAVPLPADRELESVLATGTETILLLEDEDALRQVTGELLSASGYNVLQTGRGSQAIELVEQYKESISLLISDVVLPDISGPSVAAKVRRIHPETQVLYISGYTEAPVAQQLIDEGAILMQKPISRKDLLRKVDEMIHFSVRDKS